LFPAEFRHAQDHILTRECVKLLFVVSVAVLHVKSVGVYFLLQLVPAPSRSVSFFFPEA